MYDKKAGKSKGMGDSMILALNTRGQHPSVIEIHEEIFSSPSAQRFVVFPNFQSEDVISLKIASIFPTFFEKTEDETLIEQAEAIMARVQAEHPGQPILLREYFSAEDRPVMDAYREFLLRNNPFETPSVNNADQVQEATTSVPSAPPTAPFQPSSVAIPFAAPYACFTKPIHQLVESIAKKPTGKFKYTAVEAAEILLSRAIVRNFDQKFYFFNGSVFQNIPDNQIGCFVHSWISDVVQYDGTAQVVKNVVTILRTHPAAQAYQTTDHPNQLYFLNGALDISTGQLRDIDPWRDYFTTFVPVEYPLGQSVSCPHMDRFLSTCFGGNEALIETAWQMLGYLLTCDTSAKCFFALVGVGNSGKSVFCRLIDHLFNPGSAAYCTPDQLSGRFGAHALRDCRINICAELPYGKITFEFMGFLKSVTGNDMRMTEQKFRDAQQFNPNCKFVFASNFNLQISGADDAFWNRLILLPFSFAIPPEQQDKELLDKLVGESPAIVVKAVEAFKRLRANNYVFPVPCGNVRQIRGVYGYVSDAEMVIKFVEECCEFAPEFSETTSQLHLASINFCDRYHLLPIADRVQFSRNLHNICGDRIHLSKWKNGKSTVNGYRGIRLKARWN